MTFEQARAALPSLEESYRRNYPEKIDAQFQLIGDDASGRYDGESAAGVCDFAYGGRVRVADRVQQCGESACSLGSADGGARSRCAWRLARRVAASLRLFVFESLLVSVIAGILGAALAWYVVPLVPKMAANFLPFDRDTRRAAFRGVLGFTIGLSILTGLAMGIYPALQTSRADLVGA